LGIKKQLTPKKSTQKVANIWRTTNQQTTQKGEKP
jgi:hypothetical protein